MRVAYRKRITFIGKSLIWSAVLYMLTIVVLDWNELRDSKQTAVIESKNATINHTEIDASTHSSIKSKWIFPEFLNKVSFLLSKISH